MPDHASTGNETALEPKAAPRRRPRNPSPSEDAAPAPIPEESTRPARRSRLKQTRPNREDDGSSSSGNEENDMNQTTVMGHLGADPEVRFTSGGQKVTTLRVAANQRRGGKEEKLEHRVGPVLAV